MREKKNIIRKLPIYFFTSGGFFLNIEKPNPALLSQDESCWLYFAETENPPSQVTGYLCINLLDQLGSWAIYSLQILRIPTVEFNEQTDFFAVILAGVWSGTVNKILYMDSVQPLLYPEPTWRTVICSHCLMLFELPGKICV